MVSFDWLSLLSGLFGGLALFLYGLDLLSRGLRAVAGDRMRTLLSRLTGNRWAGLTTGAVATGIIQSSSVTTVLVVGFISAGVMSLTQAIPVIYGANIGSTVTAQIIAFKVTQIALPLFALGFGAFFFVRNDRWRDVGMLTMGLGLVFFGMGLMGDTMKPLRDYEPFLDFLTELRNPFLGILVGAAFTALIQSSAATTGIAIVLAGHGLMTLEAGIALAFGANIGTCVTALLAAIGKPREAVRAAFVHVLFNVIGVGLWVFAIPELAWLVVEISPSAEELTGTARLAAEVPRQIANAHTIFNVINAFLFVGFTEAMARLVLRLVPPRPVPAAPAATPKYLKDEIVTTPSLALDAVRTELARLGVLVERMLDAIIPAALTGSQQQLEAVAAMDSDVDGLHAAITDYMRRIGQGRLSTVQMDRYVRTMSIANALENIGDVIETDLVLIGLRRIEGDVVVSAPTQQLLRDLHARTVDAVHLAIKAASAGDAEAARRVVAMKAGVQALAHQAAEHGAHRLTAKEPNRLRAYTREMEMVERLRRIYYFAKRIAKLVLEEQEAAPQSPAPPAKEPAEAAPPQMSASPQQSS